MKKSRTVYWIEYMPIRLALTLAKPLPIALRSDFIGWLVSTLLKLAPGARRRVENNLRIAFPDISQAEVKRITSRTGFYLGKSLTELFNLNDFIKSDIKMRSTGPGLAQVKSALDEGKGIMIVSGHLGQWDAVRDEFRRMGRKIGVVYKPNNNPFYDKLFCDSLKVDGTDLYAKGTRQLGHMIRSASKGGVIVILSDQRFGKGDLIPFFGRNTLTSTAPADIALKLGIPLIPAFSLRRDWGIEAVFDEAIPHTTPIEMMQRFHELLEDRIREAPEQWYWFHNRWAGVPKDQRLPTQEPAVDRQEK